MKIMNYKKILREGLVLESRIKFDISVPEDIQNIKNIFTKNGFKLFLVGGCVRDAILNKDIKDYDLATDAIPDKVEEILNKANLRTLPTGKAFGVINVFTDQDEYEVATFRSDDSYTDGRRPDSVTFGSIENDAARRDLTINALYYDLETREIIDLVGGLNDIKNGIIRTVGKPEDRFKEDRLRILRTIRFSARFGSNLDELTDSALKVDASLDGISGERIRDEFIKGLISSKSQKHFLNMILKYKLFDWIFKGLNIDVSFINGLKTNENYILLIARLLKTNDLDILRKKLNDLKYSVDEVKSIIFLIAMLKLNIDTAVTLKKAQQNGGVSDEVIKRFCEYESIDTKLLNAFLKFRLSVSGPEVMDMFNLKPGPEVGKTIHKIETENFKKLL